MNAYTLADQVKDTIAAHGIQWAAKHYSKKLCFTHFHFLAFGYLPRARLLIIGGKKVTLCLPR